MEPFPVRDVSSWDVVRAETLGRDRKVWLRDPAVAHVLDAWVANQDRHDQNWAVKARSGSQELRLAPSYDHAGSLAFSRLDSYREKVLRARGMRAFAERGRAARFEHDPRCLPREVPTLVTLARRSLDLPGRRLVDTGSPVCVQSSRRSSRTWST